MKSIGGPDTQGAYHQLAEQDTCRRIWVKDYTVWQPEPTEISDRLGWLTVIDIMRAKISELQSFADEVRRAGFRWVVLLGMGGSSLGAEVLRQVFGSAAGFPELIVLDTTLPVTIKVVTETIKPAQTLFLVSSKSGTTIEPLLLYRYFRDMVERVSGRVSGSNFVAITDAGTPLQLTAHQDGFRKIFLNPGDIGGRYSVLSYFGLVPAVLLGIDIEKLLARAATMQERCKACTAGVNNPGLGLGTLMGRLAQQGVNKLTLVTSPLLSSFGLWVEQLIAESTGKDGKGIVPITGEPRVAVDTYSRDRLFVYMHLKGSTRGGNDRFIKQVTASSYPAVVLEMQDTYDLGAEFFRWEFATATAGAILGVHPFNQPDVQSAKRATERVLRQYIESKQLPRSGQSGSLEGLLAKALPGSYLAIMAYLPQTPMIDQALLKLRRKVLQKYRLATTLGYGPRFLHSTGQLHKGGPPNGLLLQITAPHEADVAIPGEPYPFGIVADAQAMGDWQALQTAGRQIASIYLPQASAVAWRSALGKF